MRSATLLIALSISATAAAEPSPQPDAELRAEIAALRARQNELEKRLAAAEAQPAAKKGAVAGVGPGPVVRIGRDGFVLGTPDGKYEVRLRALVHIDGRAYFGDEVHAFNDTFLLRRMRPYIEGTLFGIVDFRIMPDFGQGQAAIVDGYVDVRPWSWLRLRAGRFKVPLSLEQLQSDTTSPVIERSAASQLSPARDIGVMLFGDVAHGAFTYQLGVFHGAVDGGNGPDLDTSAAKDYFFRVFAHPLRPLKIDALARLGLGAGASYGRQQGTATATGLPSYRSSGQQTYFSYLNPAMMPDLAVTAAGERWRIAPQMYWFVGPVGVMGEYTYSSHRLQRAGVAETLAQQSWSITFNFAMSLEKTSFDGITPKRPINFKDKNFGAFELVLRYAEVRIDEKAFPMFADPGKSARAARELVGGINWYLTEQVRFMIAFHRTDYLGGAPMGADREPENALLGRLALNL
jgi:phosphate-selective porin OprO and OprP